MRRKVVVAAVGVAVLLGGVCTPLAAQADSSVDSITGLGMSRFSTAFPTVKGIVRDAAGTTQGGARVELVAWPSDDVLDALPDGAEVPLTVLAVDQTDADGNYMLALPAGVTTPVNDEGNANLEVNVFGDGYVASQAVEAHPYFATAGGGGVNLVSSDLTVSPTPSVDLTTDAASSITTATTSIEPAVVNPAIIACTSVKQTTLGTRAVSVGQAYTGPHAKANFSFTSGGSTSIGVAVEAFGVWKASGSTSTDTTATQAFATVPANSRARFRTQFKFAKFTSTCTSPSVRAVSFAGGNVSNTPTSTPSATYCVPEKTGDSFSRSTSTASTISGGASLSGDIGINLDSHAGYTSNVSIHFTFTATGSLCGTKDYPGGTPGVLVGK